MPGKAGFNIALSFFLKAWHNQQRTEILPNFLSPKGLRYSNLKPETLECDWVLDMIIWSANVYLGRDNKPGYEAVGTNV